jgi:hypothetical protein
VPEIWTQDKDLVGQITERVRMMQRHFIGDKKKEERKERKKKKKRRYRISQAHNRVDHYDPKPESRCSRLPMKEIHASRKSRCIHAAYVFSKKRHECC